MLLFDLEIKNSIKNEFLKKSEKLINNKDFILGKEVKEFENNFSTFLNTKYCIGLNSGTDALELALKSLKLDKTHNVCLPAYSFFSTSEVVLKLGLDPVYVDINLDDLTIDIEDTYNKINKKTRAIIPVHIFGNAANLKELGSLKNIKIIEDVAQAFGSKQNNNYLGSIGDIGCFSFFPTKNLGGFGDGGAVVTNNKEYFEEIKSLRVHGQTKRYFHEKVGYNSRLDTIQAIILNLKLKEADKNIKKRIKNVKRYIFNFENNENIKVHIKNPNANSLIPISITKGKLSFLKKELEKNNIPYGNYYPYGLHEFPISKNRNIKLTNVEWATKNVLTLPCGPNITQKNIDNVCDVIQVTLDKF
tara:strand:- start:896 stop:1975 length:1080 start_codon:yes stop_codon:yes gene_type:complete